MAGGFAQSLSRRDSNRRYWQRKKKEKEDGNPEQTIVLIKAKPKNPRAFIEALNVFCRRYGDYYIEFGMNKI